MSVGPIGGDASPAALAAYVATELAALASDAQTLRASVSPGDTLQAVVLPSNGLTDLLEIGGLRVAAALPSTLLPGEAIRVEVTGFEGDRINLHVLGPALNATVPDSAAPPLARRLSAPPPAARPAAPDVRPLEARLATARTSHPPPGQTLVAVEAARVPRPAVAPLGAGLRPPIGLRPATPEPAVVAVPVRAGSSDYTDPARLLRALGLPVVSQTLAGAKAALSSPVQVARALSGLAHALAAPGAPPAGTLRAVTGFLARLEPASPVLAAQVASFVDHVVTGREVKLSQLLAARAGAAPPRIANADFTPTHEGSAGPVAVPQSAGPVSGDGALERVALREASLDYDLKTQLHSVAAGLGSLHGSTAAVTAVRSAIQGVLTAITALQVGASSALAANPDGFAFALPVALPHGHAQAQVRIDRDAPRDDRRVALDGDNFHIAFVLETTRLGAVAIDVVTVGRSVTLRVKTETEPARVAFSAALAHLTERLETLRYRVVAADAAVAPPAPPTVAAPQARPQMADRVPAALQRVDIDA